MKKLVVEYWAPLLVWLISIFCFSTDSFSSGQTSRFVVPILMFLFPSLSPPQVVFLHGVVRKFAHISEYFVLAVFAYRTLKYQQDDLLVAKVQTAALVLAAALVDEFHQSFTVSRGASIVDVAYDCFGAVWALWFITTYEIRRLRSHPVL